MAKNFDLDDGTMYSGAIMMALGKYIGRQNAHELLVRLRVEADDQDVLLWDLYYSD
ncbi:hypothetical protein HMPREF9103_02018, partial [Lentilactobacillus parafarraginis F0439]